MTRFIIINIAVLFCLVILVRYLLHQNKIHNLTKEEGPNRGSSVHTLLAEELKKHLEAQGYAVNVKTESVSSQDGFNNAVNFGKRENVSLVHSISRHKTAAKIVARIRSGVDYNPDKECDCDRCKV